MRESDIYIYIYIYIERERERDFSGIDGLCLERCKLPLHSCYFNFDDWREIIRIDFCSVNRQTISISRKSRLLFL